VFIAFLSGLTNTAYTATQYALFSSIMTLPGKVIGGFSGVIVDWLQSSARDVPAFAALLDAVGAAPKFGGYAIFFAYTALLGLPALVLAVIVRRHFEKETPPSARKEG
jgi:PAT family beta-lactamase induction signal transducer AmpG